MTIELTDNERALLAREVAADKSFHNPTLKEAFYDGWDAAME